MIKYIFTNGVLKKKKKLGGGERECIKVRPYNSSQNLRGNNTERLKKIPF